MFGISCRWKFLFSKSSFGLSGFSIHRWSIFTIPSVLAAEFAVAYMRRNIGLVKLQNSSTLVDTSELISDLINPSYRVP